MPFWPIIWDLFGSIYSASSSIDPELYVDLFIGSYILYNPSRNHPQTWHDLDPCCLCASVVPSFLLNMVRWSFIITSVWNLHSLSSREHQIHMFSLNDGSKLLSFHRARTYMIFWSSTHPKLVQIHSTGLISTYRRWETSSIGYGIIQRQTMAMAMAMATRGFHFVLVTLITDKRVAPTLVRQIYDFLWKSYNYLKLLE